MENLEMSLFDKLTKEDNFKKLMALRSFYDDVIKINLTNQFWTAIKDEINNRNNDWQAEYYEHEAMFWYYKNSWMDAKHSNAPLAVVSKQTDGKTYYGILMHYAVFKKLKSQFDSLRLNIDHLDLKSLKLKKDDPNFLVWTYINDKTHFQSQDTMLEILPSNRNKKVDEFIRLFQNLAQMFETTIDEFCKTNINQ